GEPLPLARVVPESSSWGYRGYSETWINPRNDWMIRPLHEATEAVLRIVSRHRHAREERKVRALNMLARELLLLQSSDWNFLIDRGISVSYVERRFFGHIGALKAISEMIVGDCLRESYLNRLASEQAAFPEADFRWLLAD
ncbi:MAG: 1,4-alpha-glucan branching protein domain-containing protein, partial [Thermodesulfovibrionales bacterium]